MVSDLAFTVKVVEATNRRDNRVRESVGNYNTPNKTVEEENTLIIKHSIFFDSFDCYLEL